VSIEFALIGTGLGLGLRHGVDWDHIAAITDVTGTQPERAKAMRLGALYALGHATVVVLLGLAALWAGSTLPDSMDAAMEAVVGATLLSLGLWLTYSLLRDGSNFQLRSRWMLVFAAVRRLGRVIDTRLTGRVHEHPRSTETRDAYGAGTAYGIGAIHGVGAETGSQVLLFAAAAGATSNFSGSLLLFAFVVGLLVSNAAITIGSVLGFSGSRTHRAAYVTLGAVTAVFSLVVGGIFLFGQGSVLPELLT
jgi:high-affinity nickel-transport protein